MVGQMGEWPIDVLTSSAGGMQASRSLREAWRGSETGSAGLGYIVTSTQPDHTAARKDSFRSGRVGS